MNHPYYTPADLPPEPPAKPLPPGGMDPDDIRQHFSRLGLAYLILTVGVGTATYATTLAVRALCPSLLTSWWFIWFLSLVPLYAVALPLLWLCLRRIPTSPHDPRKTIDGVTVDNPPFGAPRWFSLLIISFGCMVVGSLAGNYIMSLLSAVTGHDYASSLSVAIDTTPPWFTLLCTCIWVPWERSFSIVSSSLTAPAASVTKPPSSCRGSCSVCSTSTCSSSSRPPWWA